VPIFGLKPGQKVLDVGTGTGVLIPFLTQEVGPSGSVTAIDNSVRMIQRCRRKYAHLHNVTIALQDVEALAVPDETFDVVTCFDVFPHLQAKEQTLHHLHWALRPGGTLIIAHALSCTALTAHHRDVSPAVRHDMLPNEVEMRRLLTQARFTGINIHDEADYYLCIGRKPRQRAWSRQSNQEGSKSEPYLIKRLD
jgi:demethylmenaquinone methyltransferase/2-methoxy-6-polyprenyl-1,4-benzoquinol methylase